jgi:hypothetical protein
MPKIKKYDVIIYWRYVKLDVVIPEQYAWEFMAEFGKTFAVTCAWEGGSFVKAIDGYYEHPGGWHIQVSITDTDEMKFYDFLRNFCQQRNLSFREPGKDLIGILQILRELEVKANNTPVPDLLQVIPPKEEVKELVRIAQQLQFLHQNYKSFKVVEKYQKKG